MAVAVADSGGATATSVVANNAASVGDLYFLFTQGQSPAGVLSDTLSGSYAQLQTVTLGSGDLLVLAWIKVTVAGTPTFNSNSANCDRIGFIRYHGFVTGPVIITADASTNTATGTAFSSTSFNASKANEIAIIVIDAAAQTLTQTSTQFGASLIINTSLSVAETSSVGLIAQSTPIAYTGNLGVSGTWGNIVQGFYDGTVGSSSMFLTFP